MKNKILEKSKSFYISLKTPDEVEKYAKMMQSNSSDEVEKMLRWCSQILLIIVYVTIMLRFWIILELQLINTMIKNMLNKLLSQTILVSDYNKIQS